MKKLAFLILFVWLACPLQAQTDSLLPTRLRYEVATDLLWLIDKNNVPRTSLFFRYNFRKRAQALRFRIGTDNKRDNTIQTIDDSTLYIFEPDKRNLYALNIGYEWQKMMGEWQLYYGTEALFQYEVEKNYIPNKRPWIGYEATEYNRIWTVGLNGFIGGKYFITPHFSISVESNFNVSFRRWRRTLDQYFYYPNTTQYVFNGNDEISWRIALKPIHVLQFSYLF